MRAVLVATLLGGSLVGAGLSAPALGDATYGSLSVSSAVIQPGCHDYGYHYVIHPPANTDWTFVVTVHAPDGTQDATQLYASGADAQSGPGSFQLCSSQTPPGTYTLTGELDFSNGSQETPTQVFVDPVRFTLSNPSAAPVAKRKHHHPRHHRKHRARHHRVQPATAALPAL